MFRSSLIAAVLAATLLVSPAAAAVDGVPAFDRLEAMWSVVTDYSMTIDAHEVLGDDSADSELHFAFKRPDRARLDVLKGNKSGSTVVLDSGGETVTAYMRAFPAFKKHGGARDKDLTSLRGNGILMSSVDNLIACFAAHRKKLRQFAGPTIGGFATDEIVLPYAHVTCMADSSDDLGKVTLDTIDIARGSGLILMRKRYAGREIVERWQLSDYKLNTGLDDEDLE